MKYLQLCAGDSLSATSHNIFSPRVWQIVCVGNCVLYSTKVNNKYAFRVFLKGQEVEAENICSEKNDNDRKRRAEFTEIFNFTRNIAIIPFEYFFKVTVWNTLCQVLGYISVYFQCITHKTNCC